ncbi:MAG: (Fe-S)-binding protein [Candidatus Bathyarchaeia archaeon]
MTQNILTLNDEVWERLLDASGGAMNPCYQCGTCTATCPWGAVRKDPYQVRRMVRSAQLGLKWNTDDLWLCTTCKLCESRCPRGVRIIDAIRGLKILAFEDRKTPSKLENVLWSVYEEGNSWGGKSADRGKWADELNVKDASKGVKVLYYVGCSSSYDPRLQKISKAIVRTLNAACVDFGILGKQEKCCGDVIYHIGEEGFLEELVQKNVEAFQKTGAETVVTLSPHCSNMFQNIYPRYGAKFEALHYTQFLERLWDEGKLKIEAPSGSKENRVTYHDPCYLGRYNNIYESPRRIIEAVTGGKLEEMRSNHINALCCGGGGGRMWLETPPEERFSNLRVKEAAEVEANVMATSCPYCIQNFEDSAKTQGLREMKVADVAELVAAALH